MNAKPVRAAFSQIEKLAVQLDFYGRSLEVGTLAWSEDERRGYFEYHRDFLDAPLPLAPFKLAPVSGVIAAPYAPFDGLHGLFNDSLPDGWGRLLLDRRLQKHNTDHRLLTPLDRLAFVGRRGMGALRYVPDKVFGKHPDSDIDIDIDLDWAAAQADQIQAEVDEADVDRLQEIQGGSAGARPKIMVGLKPDAGRVVADTGADLPDEFEHWMVKFKSNADPKGMGAEEYAYSIMAREAGLDLPVTRLIKGAKDSYFAVRRFDRTPEGSTHIQTVSGLLEADHRAPQIDYETLLKVTRLLTKDERHVRQMFRRMVFNVLAHNRDDHSKNHAFLLAKDGHWHPTPAYDLTLSEGPGGEHSLAVNGEGRRPTRTDIWAVGKGASIPDGEIQEMLDHVRAAIDRWPDFAASAGLSQKRTDGIDYLLNGRGKAVEEE
jgi:serine/threonine-protein kinase HipA